MTDDKKIPAVREQISEKVSLGHRVYKVLIMADGTNAPRPLAEHEKSVRVDADTMRIFIAASLFGEVPDVMQKCSGVCADDPDGLPVIVDGGDDAVLVPMDVICRLLPSPTIEKLRLIREQVFSHIVQNSEIKPDDEMGEPSDPPATQPPTEPVN